MDLKPQPEKKTSVKLNSSITWGANLLPPQIKAIMPHWSLSAAIVTIAALVSSNELVITMLFLFWASMVFTLAILAVEPYIGRQKSLIPGYHALLFALVAKPVLAQPPDAGAVCTANGLFNQVTNFVNTVFGNISFGGATAVGSLSALICQVVGLLTVGLLLGFLGVLGTVSYQVGYQRQPIATVLDPVFGFLIFAGGATFVTTVMLGAA